MSVVCINQVWQNNWACCFICCSNKTLCCQKLVSRTSKACAEICITLIVISNIEINVLISLWSSRNCWSIDCCILMSQSNCINNIWWIVKFNTNTAVSSWTRNRTNNISSSDCCVFDNPIVCCVIDVKFDCIVVQNPTINHCDCKFLTSNLSTTNCLSIVC